MTSADVKSSATQGHRAVDSPPDAMIPYGRRESDSTSDALDQSSVRCADQESLLLHLVEVSVVMPCLNEEASVGICVTKALAGFAACGVVVEVIVCDNGSSDNSIEVARSAGARVVRETARGYGNAYLTGFDAATGRIIVMGDSDDSYDFTQLGALVDKINEGYDYVLGSRFGGEIRQGAMSWSHRYIGNPIRTAVLNRFFGLESSDAHSGMRAFTRKALDRMALRCEGMEFASEIVVKAARAHLRVAEVPIIYHPRIGESKLNTLKDGWRHLRFLLLLSPVYLFLLPGTSMLILGITGQAVI
ncbi:MAG: glycosyltransferase family 2 protein, partial [Candidatus Dormibacteraceae bacterium]